MPSARADEHRALDLLGGLGAHAQIVHPGDDAEDVGVAPLGALRQADVALTAARLEQHLGKAEDAVRLDPELDVELVDERLDDGVARHAGQRARDEQPAERPQDERLAEVVEHAGEEDDVGRADAALHGDERAREGLGHRRVEHARPPVRVGVVLRAHLDVEERAARDADGDARDLARAEERDRGAHGLHGDRPAVRGGVRDRQDGRRRRGLALDEVRQAADVDVRVLGDVDDARGHGGERRGLGAVGVEVLVHLADEVGELVARGVPDGARRARRVAGSVRARDAALRSSGTRAVLGARDVVLRPLDSHECHLAAPRSVRARPGAPPRRRAPEPDATDAAGLNSDPCERSRSAQARHT